VRPLLVVLVVVGVHRQLRLVVVGVPDSVLKGVAVAHQLHNNVHDQRLVAAAAATAANCCCCVCAVQVTCPSSSGLTCSRSRGLQS
jgi:hypothetical protein